MCLHYLKFSDPLLETHLFFIWPRMKGVTVDSKIDENRYNKKYEVIQGIGVLYRYISLTVFNCSNMFTDITLFK